MKAYCYNPKTKEYEGQTTIAQPNPRKKGQYLTPANATLVVPPVKKLKEGQTLIFNGIEWDIVEKKELPNESKVIFDIITKCFFIADASFELENNHILVPSEIKEKIDNGEPFYIDEENKALVIVEEDNTDDKDEDIEKNLETAKNIKWAQIQDLSYQSRNQGYVEYQDMRFSISEQAKVNLTSVTVMGQVLGTVEYFEKNGTQHTFTIDEFIPIAVVIGKGIAEAETKYYHYENLVKAAKTIEEVEAISWED